MLRSLPKSNKHSSVFFSLRCRCACLVGNLLWIFLSLSLPKFHVSLYVDFHTGAQLWLAHALTIPVFSVSSGWLRLLQQNGQRQRFGVHDGVRGRGVSTAGLVVVALVSVCNDVWRQRSPLFPRRLLSPLPPMLNSRARTSDCRRSSTSALGSATSCANGCGCCSMRRKRDTAELPSTTVPSPTVARSSPTGIPAAARDPSPRVSSTPPPPQGFEKPE